MTEAEEIALNISEEVGLFALEEVRTMDQARSMARDHLGDETEQVVDNVAEGLFNLAKRIRE